MNAKIYDDETLDAGDQESGDDELLASQFVARYDRGHTRKRPRSPDAESGAEDAPEPAGADDWLNGETLVVNFRRAS